MGRCWSGRWGIECCAGQYDVASRRPACPPERVPGILAPGTVTQEDKMWDPVQRSRFQALRQREEEGVLTATEQAELERMMAEIEAAEAASLAPATERLRAERAQTAAQNTKLQE